MAKRAVRVTAVAASAQLGGAERVLLDFAARAFEHDIALRVLTPRGGPLIAILNEIGVPADVVPASARLLAGSQRAGHLWTLPASAAGLVAWARRLAGAEFLRDADAIYTVAFKAHLAIAWLKRRPVVWHLHEYPPAATSILWRLASRLVPDAMIANSEATASAWVSGERYAAASGERYAGGLQATSELAGGRPAHRSPLTRFRTPASRRVVVIRNGVDLDRFRPRPRTYWIHDRLGIPREHRIIGMPAVFARWKGQLEVIQAFAAVAARFPDVHVVIVGGSIYDTVGEQAYGSELESAVRGARSADMGPLRTTHDAPRTHLLPFQPKIELVYPEFDLALHYSLRPEPFGRVILEAMACGVPVIAAAEGGPVEIVGTSNIEHRTSNIEHRTSKATCGWLAPPRNVLALADTLRQALSLPPDQLRAMGEAARRRAEDHFSARQFARRVADILRNVALETR